MKKYFGFTQNVFFLSTVSFLNDIGGETIKNIIPLFLANVLHTPTTIIGFIEGVGEATPQLLQPFSGLWSDKLKKRKVFVFGGQILRSSMLLLVFVSSWPQVLLIRFLDRSGKGISTAPRDALISLSTPDTQEGRAFGLNRAMDNLGAVLGLTVAGLLMWFFHANTLLLSRNTFIWLVMIAAIPLVVSLILIGIKITDIQTPRKQALAFNDHLHPSFYKFLFISFLFSLGNFSDGFLSLKAQAEQVNLLSILFLLAQFSLVSAIVSLPAGMLSDKIGRKTMLGIGWLVYAVTYLGFTRYTHIGSLIVLFSLYGVYYGMTSGVAKAFVSDVVNAEKRGVAYGLYNLIVGFTLLPASVIAGYLWQYVSPDAPFYFGSITSLFAVIGLWVLL